MPETVLTHRDSKPCGYKRKALIMLRHDFKVGEDSVLIENCVQLFLMQKAYRHFNQGLWGFATATS